MLARAVDRRPHTQNAKPATLSQQLFPSSSPTPVASAFKNGPQSPYPPHKQPYTKSIGSVLQPTASSVLNGPNAPRQSGVLYDRKRATGQANGLAHTLSKKDSFQENSSGSLLVEEIRSAGTNGIRKLQDAVYFDENDFEDDAELDFDIDIEEPVANGNVSYPKLLTNVSASNNTYTPDANRAPPSSAPFEWSSSPPQHKITPPAAAALQRQRDDGFEGAQPAYGTEDPNPRPTKRRTIPWLDTEDRIPAIPQASSHSTSRAIRGTKSSDFPQVEFTPLPKNSSKESPHPWNKTYSAVKEEQKRLKQRSKRSLKSNHSKDEGSAIIPDPRPKKGVARVFLSDEQQRVINLVVKGKKSVFFTGSAGTGKSVLMREIIAELRKAYVREPDRLAVTASTGLAACNIGGVTLHSFGGIGLGKGSVPELVKKIKRSQKAKTRWMRTKTLIVDEISMVDGELFDKLENIARIIKNNGRPFGGIQLIITGDFFQLPPVPDYGKVAKFAFDAATWNTSIEHTICLTQIFRQKDPEFANMLNEMRLGKLTQASINTFRTLNRPIESSYGLEATELFPTRSEVDRANNMKLNSLTGDKQIFDASDGGSIQDKTQRDKLLANCMAPQSLELKVGAQVMLIKNMDETLVNGSLGRVVDFMDEATYEVWTDEGDEGLRDLEGDGSDEEVVKRSKKKLKAMMNKNLGSSSLKYPRVEFALADGTTRTILVVREVWKIELPDGEIQASRSQIPLILAWALSIHKAQGQTLDCVKVDLGKVFEKGQAYVALSRATCQKGLQVLRFDPKKVMAHDKVRNFYDTLYSVDEAARPTAPKKPGTSAQDYEKGYMAASMDSFGDDEEAMALMASY